MQQIFDVRLSKSSCGEDRLPGSTLEPDVLPPTNTKLSKDVEHLDDGHRQAPNKHLDLLSGTSSTES